MSNVNKPWDIGKVGVGVNNSANSAGLPHLTVGQQFTQSVVVPQGPAHGDMRRQADGTIEMYDGANWINVSPNQMAVAAPVPEYTLDLDAQPVDALALAIYKTYEAVPGANLPASRKAAADVIRTLGELGFVLTQDYGSVSVAHQEDDFDFSDICNPCARATDAYAAYFPTREDGTAPPDRFCLFHRGYVMGQLA